MSDHESSSARGTVDGARIRLDGRVFAGGGATITWLTDGRDFSDYRPVFSPDGNAVLFERTPAGGGANSTLYILRLDGSEPEPFLKDPPPEIVNQTRPDWHAGCDDVAFCAGAGQVFICLARGDGTNARLLRDTGGMIYPAWAAGGQALAVMQTGGDGPYTVCIDREGKVLQRMSPQGLYAGMPSLSQQIPPLLAFPGQPANPPYVQDNNRIYVATNPGSAFLLDGKQGRAPWWSPDGQALAFESDRSGRGYAVYASTPDGSRQARLTDPLFNAQHPKFSPDGKTIVLAARPEPGSAWAIGTIPLSF